MALTEEVLYQQDAVRGHWLSKLMFFLISLSFVVAFMTITKSKGEIPYWPFAIPPVIFGALLWVINQANKATLTITKSHKGELHCELKTKSKLIIQGPPTSMFYWIQIKSNMTHETGLATIVEIKTKYGDTIALTSPSNNIEYEKMEQRAMTSEHPIYKVASVGKVIEVLDREGIPFSFK